MNDYTCAQCATPVTTAAFNAYFNALHQTSKGLVLPNLFAESGLCPVCWRFCELARMVDSLCANFTGIHTKLNALEKRVKKLEGKC